MLVIATIHGSRAEKAGVSVGTLIASVDNRAVPDRQRYIAIRATCSLSDGIILDTFLPGGTAQQFVIKLGQ